MAPIEQGVFVKSSGYSLRITKPQPNEMGSYRTAGLRLQPSTLERTQRLGDLLAEVGWITCAGQLVQASEQMAGDSPTFHALLPFTRHDIASRQILLQERPSIIQKAISSTSGGEPKSLQRQGTTPPGVE